jgi:hypothetical protein
MKTDTGLLPEPMVAMICRLLSWNFRAGFARVGEGAGVIEIVARELGASSPAQPMLADVSKEIVQINHIFTDFRKQIRALRDRQPSSWCDRFSFPES